jgi:hypothetical protein
MRKHSADEQGLAGTGAELAEHLFKRYQMDGYRVELTQPHQDHFDPRHKVVRLSPDNFNGKSITAIAVAAHEVGHAIQCFRNEKVFQLRATYLPIAAYISNIGGYILIAAPLLFILTKSPAAIIGVLVLRITLMLLSALTYLLVLPEEWDASFSKAMPILEKGNYLDQAQLPAARQVLRAAALTYFAAALTKLLSLGSLLRALRR